VELPGVSVGQVNVVVAASSFGIARSTVEACNLPVMAESEPQPLVGNKIRLRVEMGVMHGEGGEERRDSR